MKMYKNWLLLIAIVVIVFSSRMVVAQELKVLFIGNSQTYSNGLPQMVKRIADSLGRPIEVSSFTMGGYRFYQHVDNPSTLSRIQSEQWDYVVLQEGLYASLPVDLAEQQSYPFAQQLYDWIKANCPTTQVLLYMIHAFADGNFYHCAEDPPVCTYEGMYERITTNHLNMGRMLNVPVAPCGVVWNEMLATYGDLGYWDNDTVHPLPLGSYISACTIFATIFGQSPAGGYISPSISAEVASNISTVVTNVVLDDSSSWCQSHHPPTGQQVTNFNTGKQYPSIKNAIWAAQPGEKIVLEPGIYQEDIILTKGITLQSVDPNNPFYVGGTIIQGDPNLPVVSLPAGSDDCRINGLTLRSGSVGVWGIMTSATLYNCRIMDNLSHGVDLTAANPTLSHCLITANDGYGINMQSQSVTTGTGRQTITTEISCQPVIENCIIVHNGDAAIESGEPVIVNSIID